MRIVTLRNTDEREKKQKFSGAIAFYGILLNSNV
jgi:hypothetical protein